MTGGTFYTGDTWPSEFRGAFIFGDWLGSWMRYLTLDGDAHTSRTKDFAAEAAGPVDLEFDPDGNLYYVALNKGEIRRITYRGG